MASFTDKTPQFNPYVSQQPVDAMVKVGMMKQQQYDTNLQKIHQSMSHIAGLPVSRDVDKQYLENKMHEMSGKLQGYAAGDLSSNQLTSSIRGMIGGIANDEIVQNSVRSTMAVQEAKQLQSHYNAKGEGSPSNDYAFGTQLQSWLTDASPGATFRGGYTPYVPYKEQSVEIIKALAADYVEGEVALDYDEKGNIIGVRDAISNTVVEELTPMKIQTALKAGLTPAAWNQISMDGVYQYSGVSDEAFIQSTREKYENILNSASKKIEDLRSVEENLSDPNSKLVINQQIKSLEQYSTGVEQEFNSVNRQLTEGNLDGAKAKLYTIDWMDDMANSFSSSSVKKTYRKNPFMDAELTRAKMRQTAEIAKAKYLQDDRHFMMNYGLKLQDQQIERNKLSALGGVGGSFGPIELPTATEELSDKEYINQQFEEQNAVQTELEVATSKLLKKYDMTKSQMKDSILVKKNGTKTLSLDLSEELDKIEALQDEVETRAQTEAAILINADVLYPTQTRKVMTPEQNQTFTAQTEEGTIVDFTTDELITSFGEFDEAYASIIDPINKHGVPKVVVNDAKANRDFAWKLTDSEEEILEKSRKKAMYNIWRDRQPTHGYTSTTETKYSNKFGETSVEDIGVFAKEVKKEITPIIRDRKKEKNAYIARNLKETNLTYGSYAYGVSLPKEEHKQAFKSDVLLPLAVMAEKGGIPNSDVSGEELNAYINNFESAFVTSDGQLSLSGSHRDKPLTIPLEGKIYEEAFKGRYDMSPEKKHYYEYYVPKMLSNVNPVTPVLNTNGEQARDAYGNLVYKETPVTHWTTAKNGKYKTDLDNAMLKNRHFSNVESYTISGNVVSSVSPQNAEYVYLKLNIYDPLNNKQYTNYTLPGKVHVSQIDNTLKTFSDLTIWQMLENTQETMPDDVYQALKKAASTLNKN
jgi:uncharacterized protein YuzE